MGKLNWEPHVTEGVWVGESSEPGPTVGVIGGVHGDEPTGIQVVEASLDTLSVECGTVILMLGNLAARGKSRFQDVNLNRSFRPLTEAEQAQEPETLPYEIRRAQALIPHLDACDALLDLHDFTNPCPPFIICERNALDAARAIGAPIISFGWSITEPGGSDGYMFSQGKQGICYELGQKSKPQENLERGHGAVARFLIAQGLAEGDLAPMYEVEKMVQIIEATIAEGDLEFAREFANFESLVAGEKIAYHNGQAVCAEKGDVIVFPMKDAKVGEEAFILGYRVTS